MCFFVDVVEIIIYNGKEKVSNMSTEDFQIEVTRINRRPESEPVKPKFELNVEDDLIPENYEPNFITGKYSLLEQLIWFIHKHQE